MQFIGVEFAPKDLFFVGAVAAGMIGLTYHQLADQRGWRVGTMFSVHKPGVAFLMGVPLIVVAIIAAWNVTGIVGALIIGVAGAVTAYVLTEMLGEKVQMAWSVFIAGTIFAMFAAVFSTA